MMRRHTAIALLAVPLLRFGTPDLTLPAVSEQAISFQASPKSFIAVLVRIDMLQLWRLDRFQVRETGTAFIHKSQIESYSCQKDIPSIGGKVKSEDARLAPAHTHETEDTTDYTEDCMNTCRPCGVAHNEDMHNQCNTNGCVENAESQHCTRMLEESTASLFA